jgi:hypothetical protein
MRTGPGGLWISGCVDCDEHRDSYFAQEVDTDANAQSGPRIAVENVSLGPLFVGEDSVWFAGYARHSQTVALRLDPENQAIEEFLRVGDFLHSGMAFDAENAAIWITRAAPAAWFAWSSTPGPIDKQPDWNVQAMRVEPVGSGRGEGSEPSRLRDLMSLRPGADAPPG